MYANSNLYKENDDYILNIPRVSLSIFIPVFNEEAILFDNTKKLIEFVDVLSISYEIVICSNGSTDGTAGLGEDLERAYLEKVRFFAISEKGVGRALRFCLPYFKLQYVLSLDMDLSSDLSFVADALHFLNDHDIVIGSKRTGIQTRSFVRRVGSGFYIIITRLLLGMNYTDYSLGAKVYKKTILEKYFGWISDYGTDYVINIVYRAFKDGCRIKEIPVKCVDNRVSRFSLLKEGIYRYKKILSLWLDCKGG